MNAPHGAESVASGDFGRSKPRNLFCFMQAAIISALMPGLSLTDQQQRAIRTTGRSAVVSAAAGSGKTTVLTERVAYLACDAPPEARCRVDELLVLTFTEAAAAQMRARIVEAIRSRLRAHPGDDRLGEQLALVDAAQISTIHSFCLWLVRRWFSDVGVDPAATVMDDDETTLIKSEVLDALFSSLYAAGNAEQAAGAMGHRFETGPTLCSRGPDPAARSAWPVA